MVLSSFSNLYLKVHTCIKYANIFDSKFRFSCKHFIVNNYIKSCNVPAEFQYWKNSMLKAKFSIYSLQNLKIFIKTLPGQFSMVSKSSIQISYRLHTNNTATISVESQQLAAWLQGMVKGQFWQLAQFSTITRNRPLEPNSGNLRQSRI